MWAPMPAVQPRDYRLSSGSGFVPRQILRWNLCGYQSLRREVECLDDARVGDLSRVVHLANRVGICRLEQTHTV
jgi:hypothetical protein